MSVLGYSALSKIKKNLDAEFGTAQSTQTKSIISTISYSDLNVGKTFTIDLGTIPENSVLIHSQVNISEPFLSSASDTSYLSVGLGTQEETEDEFPVERDYRHLIFEDFGLNNTGIYEYQGELTGTSDKTLNSFLNSLCARFDMLGVWSTGGSLITARYTCTGCGSQSAGFAISGYQSSTLTSCETYNGSSWSSAGSLSTGRRGPGSCGTVDGALCFGGYDSPTYYSSTEEYNGTSWSAGGSLNSTKRYVGSAGSQTAGLCVGGVDLSGTYSETELYDGATWSLSGYMITARHYVGAAGLTSNAISFGGQLDSSNDDINITEYFNGLLWSAENNLPAVISAHGACGQVGDALSSGGEQDGTAYPYTYTYDGLNWRTSNDMSVARRTCASCGTQTSALNFGGLDSSTYKNTNEEYTLSSLSTLAQGSLELQITYSHR